MKYSKCLQKEVNDLNAKEFLKERGAKAAIAEKMGVSRQTVSLWFTGQGVPTGRNLLSLTETLVSFGIKITAVEVIALLNEMKEENKTKPRRNGNGNIERFTGASKKDLRRSGTGFGGK